MAVSVLYNVQCLTPDGRTAPLIASATAPTAAQSATVQVIEAQVSFAATDTQALVTHNFGLSATAPTFQNPQVLFEAAVLSAVGGTFAPQFTFDRTNTNVLKINKLNEAASDGTFNVTIRRPWQPGS